MAGSMGTVSSGATVKVMDGVSPKLLAAAQFYKANFAWDVEIQGNSLLLCLSGGMAAVSVPFRGGEHLFAATAALPRGPMLLVPGAPFRAFALVESDDCVVSDEELPKGVLFHRSPTKALLPPTVTSRGAVQWLREPSPKDRWLPVASGVIAALSRPQWRSHRYPLIRAARGEFS
ncbi:hypothetical protein AVL48_18465 [Amycolatopsis regifaucium]|uniref:Uncharacterized protein n=2 Tax=Amycolatopsis regifaucium TaxID=546365 RepID=A0A154MUM5_9PSEU|nr:hypothetical protein AVL48_18465 [Amycolatopsis regifaucium]OKA04515.1 hypothetical protein ATP06_0232045 [Amycolatopsis regifaucium]